MIDVEYIVENKIIAIARRIYGEKLDCLSKALLDGGIKLIECTFDQSDPKCKKKTSEAISLIREKRTGEMHVGAGTVLDVEQVNAAFEAGAEFIISPNANPAVIYRTKELGMLSIPGAMTPTEILLAHERGADLVKLFPTASLGLKYVKDIMEPISHVKIVATAGINEENLKDYLDAGISGAGICGRLTDSKIIEQGNWEEFTRRAKVFMDIVKQNT